MTASVKPGVSYVHNKLITIVTRNELSRKRLGYRNQFSYSGVAHIFGRSLRMGGGDVNMTSVSDAVCRLFTVSEIAHSCQVEVGSGRRWAAFSVSECGSAETAIEGLKIY